MNKVQEIQTMSAISIKEVAKRLSLSPRTLHRMNASGKIFAPIRVNNSIRFNEQELNAWLLAGCPDRQEWEWLKGAQHK